MIISASRRTDIPAFYARWFMERLRQGFCLVPNPFNPAQVSRISLRPEEVEVIVFWTRNPFPLFSYFDEMDSRGYQYYFLYTLMDNPRAFDRYGPVLGGSLDTFKTLAEKIGPRKVIWRYDPILFSTITPPSFHLESYARIAQTLQGYGTRSVISLIALYKKTLKRLKALEAGGIKLISPAEAEVEKFLSELSRTALANGMEVYSCAQEKDYTSQGIKPGSCIDPAYIERIFQKEVTRRKDPFQRKACGCVISKDIGMYESCLFECQYCYATGHFDRARMNFKKHDPSLPCLIPVPERAEEKEGPLNR
jgi:hypothetical protein